MESVDRSNTNHLAKAGCNAKTPSSTTTQTDDQVLFGRKSERGVNNKVWSQRCGLRWTPNQAGLVPLPLLSLRPASLGRDGRLGTLDSDREGLLVPGQYDSFDSFRFALVAAVL